MIRIRNSYSKGERVYFPPGHFYSTIPSKIDLQEKRSHYSFNDIDLNEAAQKILLERFSAIYPQLTIPLEHASDWRYYFDNAFFSFSDGTILACMVIDKKPKTIIEVGSGFSSALFLDINERFFSNEISLFFIEPYQSERAKSLLRPKDDITLIEKRVQDVELSFFEALDANDILFIDSSHISKKGSDLNHILFKILPRLRKGVIVHFHDIFNHFDYPEKWLEEGVYYNEAYLLRAFLQFNKEFKILYFNDFMENQHTDWFKTNMPNCLKPHEFINRKKGALRHKGIRGQSLWIQRK